jgi:ABC-type polysaccharide/polyol phosphate export permease
MLIQGLIELNPIYQLSETYRSVLLSKTLGPHAIRLLLSNLVLLPIFTLVAQRLMHRRVLGE